MANPSVKNGHIDIANEIAEKFARCPLSGEQWRLLWVVLRQTWGWKDGDRKKDFDWVSLSQFEEKTAMKRPNIVRNLRLLVAYKLLLKTENGYGINQNHDEWAVAYRLPRKKAVAYKLPPSSLLATSTSSLLATHNRKKDTHTKDNSSSSTKKRPRPSVDKVMAAMKESFGSLDDTDRNNRRYAWLLIQRALKIRPAMTEDDAAEATVMLIRAAAKHDWWGSRITRVSDLFRNCQKIANAVKEQHRSSFVVHI